ncbi:TonB family protein [Bradyrhizobium sp. CB1650]|uniref:TonB family protein n=1 Tax=Bradyrhizobium sp. CB1650 TaxID=3039153 RepID=UPI002435A88F|nr:TonB family protein [Bradyrhizobium sp. CB1650]WGD49167.1 TonB family protein [Bradyrhizobium sp. CB1650]
MSDLEQKSPRTLWIVAAVVALGLHLGGAALALANLRTDDPDVIADPQGIEVGLEAMSPNGEPSELPPGPDSNESVASPELTEQKAELKESSLPKDIPTEAENADRAVTPNETKKPIEEEAKEAVVPTNASTPSPAAEATAMPTSQVEKKSDRSVRIRQGWEKDLVAHLDRHKRYPKGVFKSVEISVRMTLDRLGHVVAVAIEKGSGDPTFDDAAIGMVKRSDPVPQPPPLVADEGLTFVLPVIFRKNEKTAGKS